MVSHKLRETVTHVLALSCQAAGDTSFAHWNCTGRSGTYVKKKYLSIWIPDQNKIANDLVPKRLDISLLHFLRITLEWLFSILGSLGFCRRLFWDFFFFYFQRIPQDRLYSKLNKDRRRYNKDMFLLYFIHIFLSAPSPTLPPSKWTTRAVAEFFVIQPSFFCT